MGKLVAPVYQLSPKEERILEFRGYNRKPVIADGEMRDMFNMASDEYPCLYQRKPRGLYDHGIEKLEEPSALLVKDKKLAMIAKGIFYYDGVAYPKLGLSEQTQMVAINTKICFFPEKKYFVVRENASGEHEIGDIENRVSIEGTVKVKMTEASLVFPSTYDFAKKFGVGDAVSFSTSDGYLNMSAEIEDVTNYALTFQASTFTNIIAADENKITDEASGKSYLEVDLKGFKVERTCPDLDFVLEYNNRLWGVSNKDNTIYASKLGDPCNWSYFQSTNMDSYYAEQGTDGEWTGCAAYSAHIMFFKEDWIHKVYGNKPGNYQITTAQCHALEKGSHKSVAIINETVLYKSRLGIMAYTGGIPQLISENFGKDKFYDAIAGTDGTKYYLSVLCEGEPELLVFDMERGLWHKEDDTRVRDFCYHNGKMLFINENDDKIYEMDADTPLDDEEDINWMVEFGPFDEFVEEKKVYSSMKMRLTLEEGSSLAVYIKIEDGDWELAKKISDKSERSQLVPIVPRRCDKFSIKLEGEGNCRIESLVREYRTSTMGKDVR
jgi:hypothetical protein